MLPCSSQALLTVEVPSTWNVIPMLVIPYMEGKERWKRRKTWATPDWEMAVLINEETYLQGLSWRLQEE